MLLFSFSAMGTHIRAVHDMRFIPFKKEYLGLTHRQLRTPSPVERSPLDSDASLPPVVIESEKILESPGQPKCKIKCPKPRGEKASREEASG
jgi:hypothetical protein